MAISLSEDAKLVHELGKRLYEKATINDLLDKILAKYTSKLNVELASQQRNIRKVRSFELAYVDADLVKCWKNINSEHKYRILQIDHNLLSAQVYSTTEKALSDISDYVNQKYNLDHWTWISRDVLYKQQYTELGLDISLLDWKDRIEIYGFTWENDLTEKTVYEVFCYDKVCRVKLGAYAHSGDDFKVPLKCVIDNIIRKMSLETLMNLGSNPYKSLESYRHVDDFKFIKFDYDPKTYKISTDNKVYRLTENYQFVLGGPTNQLKGT